MWPQLFLAGAGALALRAGIRAAQRAKVKIPNMPDLSALRGLEGFGGSPMSKAEAIRILNIPPQQAMDADRVREVHRRLLLANHPDRGGSTFISTKINEAKETLMGKKKYQPDSWSEVVLVSDNCLFARHREHLSRLPIHLVASSRETLPLKDFELPCVIAISTNPDLDDRLAAIRGPKRLEDYGDWLLYLLVDGSS